MSPAVQLFHPIPIFSSNIFARKKTSPRVSPNTNLTGRYRQNTIAVVDIETVKSLFNSYVLYLDFFFAQPATRLLLWFFTRTHPLRRINVR